MAEKSGIQALIVAEHIRWLRNQAGEITTPMHVLKLVYIAHGWVLGWLGCPLVKEPVLAWEYGPVIPELYHTYKVFGKQHIGFYVETKEPLIIPEQLGIVTAVERGYRALSALQLSAKTHEPGSPWDITVKKQGLNCVISNDLIERHYEEKIPESAYE